MQPKMFSVNWLIVIIRNTEAESKFYNSFYIVDYSFQFY